MERKDKVVNLKDSGSHGERCVTNPGHVTGCVRNEWHTPFNCTNIQKWPNKVFSSLHVLLYVVGETDAKVTPSKATTRKHE
jgi:hypothetical protein